MILKSGRIKVNVDDIAIFLMLVITLAFHNYAMIMAICQIVCSTIIYLSALKNKDITMGKFIYLLWFGIFTMIGFSSILWATHSGNNVLITVRSLIEEMMVGFAVVLYMKDIKCLNKILHFIFISGILLILRMIVEVPFNAWGTERVGFFVGYGANGASMVFSYISLFSFHYFQESKKKKYLLLTIILTVFSLLCGSKKALLIAIVGITLLLILKSRNTLQVLKRTIEALIIIVILYYLVMHVEAFYNVLGNRIERMFLALTNKAGGDMSTKDRMTFIASAFDVFLKHPVFGVGLDNYRFYNYMQYYAHNNFLEIAADLGIVGFISYYSLFFDMILHSASKLKNKGFAFIFTFIFVILFMDMATVSFESDFIQLFIAMLYGLYILLKQNNKNLVLKEV